MTLIERAQTYFRAVAGRMYESVPVPPFTVFIHPDTDFRFFNYAIPDQPVGGNLNAPLARLRTVFQDRLRTPRFEFVEGFAPELSSALEAAGFIEESRTQLMVCTPERYQSAPAVPDLMLVLLTPQAPDDDLVAFLATQRQAFGGDPAEPVAQADVARFRQSIGGTHSVLARMTNGGTEQPVGIGSFLAPISGLTEVAGIGTLPAYRRRGVAAALTAKLVQQAFAHGVELALLSAADQQAGRVYERIGFKTIGAMLAYSESE